MLKPHHPRALIPTVSLSWNPQLSRDALTFTLPQVPWGPGAPLQSRRLPQPYRHTHSSMCLSRGGERGQDSLVLLPPPGCHSYPPTLFLRWCYFWVSHTKRPPLSQPNSPPFWKALLTLFCRGMAYPDWCYGEEGSGPSFPQGVTWALNGGNWAGLGRGRDWPSHSGSETH